MRGGGGRRRAAEWGGNQPTLSRAWISRRPGVGRGLRTSRGAGGVDSLAAPPAWLAERAARGAGRGRPAQILFPGSLSAPAPPRKRGRRCSCAGPPAGTPDRPRGLPPLAPQTRRSRAVSALTGDRRSSVGGVGRPWAPPLPPSPTPSVASIGRLPADAPAVLSGLGGLHGRRLEQRCVGKYVDGSAVTAWTYRGGVTGAPHRPCPSGGRPRGVRVAGPARGPPPPLTLLDGARVHCF